MRATNIMTIVMEYMDERFKWYTKGSTRVLDVADEKDVDDDDDDDADDGGDEVVPLLAVGRIPSFSLQISPPNELRRLGCCRLDEFLVSLGVWSMIRFHGVEIVDLVAAKLQTTTHTRRRGRMERRLLLWSPSNASWWFISSLFSFLFFLPRDIFLF